MNGLNVMISASTSGNYGKGKKKKKRRQKEWNIKGKEQTLMMMK